MATADNKVVTFKDLYGDNSNAVLSGTNSDHLIYPYYKGAVVPDTTYGNYSAFSNSLYSKRLKYVYYGYAFVGGNANVLSQLQSSGGVTAYWNTGSWEKAKLMIPLCHINNTTSFIMDNLDMVVGDGASYILGQIEQLQRSAYGNLINYSSIASLADEDMVNDIWTEYKPIPKIDPSTGEPMKDENGKLLYETDEEGNVLYEEGDYYAETRRADEGILPI